MSQAYDKLQTDYHAAFAQHTLTQELDLENYQEFHLRCPKNGGRINSACILFTPEGIVIYGDHCPGTNGVISDYKYHLSWFMRKQGEHYLCEKFGLRKIWQPELAAEYVNHRIVDARNGEEPNEHEDEYLGEMSTIGALKELLDGLDDSNEADFLSQLADIYPDAASNGAIDACRDYDWHTMAKLTAIQHRFAELYDAMPKSESIGKVMHRHHLADFAAQVLKAKGDPGVFLPRDADESIAHWEHRAIDRVVKNWPQ